MKPGIIFDLDGTLWDATATMVEPWNKVLARHGNPHPPLTREDLCGFMGKTATEITAILFGRAALDDAALDAIVAESCEEELPYLREKGGLLYPHLTETLEELAQTHSLYIVSNCLGGYIEAFMEHHGLEDLFADYEYAGRTRLSKGENIRLVMDRNGLDNALYVGDTQSDFAAATAAGIPFIHAAYGFGGVDRDVPTAHSPADLLALIPTLL